MFENMLLCSVSYVLLCEKAQYCFHGVPGYVVHKDVFGVSCISVAVGQIQSTFVKSGLYTSL